MWCNHGQPLQLRPILILSINFRAFLGHHATEFRIVQITTEKGTHTKVRIRIVLRELIKKYEAAKLKCGVNAVSTVSQTWQRRSPYSTDY